MCKIKTKKHKADVQIKELKNGGHCNLFGFFKRFFDA